jgi:hypothetical protein
MRAQAHTFTVNGPTVRAVVVEVDVRPGLPAFSVVGLRAAARALAPVSRSADGGAASP